jgi:hypothetical protein
VFCARARDPQCSTAATPHASVHAYLPPSSAWFHHSSRFTASSGPALIFYLRSLPLSVTFSFSLVFLPNLLHSLQTCS